MKSSKKTQKKKFVFDTALELYNNLLNIFKIQYDQLTKSQKKKIKAKNIPVNLAIELYLYEDEDDLPPMAPLEDDEEVKLEPEQIITERIRLNPQKNNKNMIKSFNFKQTMNQTSNNISTNKS